jgi:hypothetical protein
MAALRRVMVEAFRPDLASAARYKATISTVAGNASSPWRTHQAEKSASDAVGVLKLL